MKQYSLLSVICSLLTVLCSGCQQKLPVIHFVDPKIGNMGEPITISGANFGDERGESFVTVAGVQPTGPSYINWQDSKIIIQTPEFGDSGLVYVHVNGKKSNSALFTNQARLPKQTPDGESGLGPKIISVKPQNGPIGSVVTITGTGFGTSRDSGGVFFSWNAEALLPVPAETRFQEFTEVSETEFGYEMWSEREIQVRIPDGAVGGNMEIRTARGSTFGFRKRTGRNETSRLTAAITPLPPWSLRAARKS